ncbi:MAG: hypothetical protein WKI04_14415 [Ferruginibacter sp.]
MKLLTVSFVCSSILLGACNKETIRGGGAVVTETRPVPEFTNIELGGCSEAIISYGTAQQVTVTGYENLQPVYETKVWETRCI